MIKKILMVATGVFLAALRSSCGIKSNSINDNNNSNQQAESKNKPEFLFILSAKEGEITKISNNKYKLVIKKSNFHEPVIAFSDRPYRIVKHLSMPQLLMLRTLNFKQSFLSPVLVSVALNNLPDSQRSTVVFL